MNRDNYEVYQLQLPQVSCWILQTAEDVAEALSLVREDIEHVYHQDHRTRQSPPLFPKLPHRRLKLDQERSEAFWLESMVDRWGVVETPQRRIAFALNHAIITSSNGHALITGEILPESWPDFLLRPAIQLLP